MTLALAPTIITLASAMATAREELATIIIIVVAVALASDASGNPY